MILAWSRWRRLGVALLIAVPFGRAHAGPCAFEPQGEGRVTDAVDGRTLRLADGREIRLLGIEALPSQPGESRAAALSAIVGGRDVTLRGADDAPDRYGRQRAFVVAAGDDAPVQIRLLAQGAALASADIADRECAAALMAAETEARRGRKGAWADSAVIKNAESTDDILAGTGRFVLVEGIVLSVRQAGATTYLNFGRRWTRDFAATISRRNLAAIEAAGPAVKSLENRRIRVRGWVEARPGPRIEVGRATQIEVLGGN